MHFLHVEGEKIVQRTYSTTACYPTAIFLLCLSSHEKNLPISSPANEDKAMKSRQRVVISTQGHLRKKYTQVCRKITCHVERLLSCVPTCSHSTIPG